MAKKIIGIIHSLSRGGAEKNFAALFNDLSLKGYSCSVICFDSEGDLFHQLNSNIEIIRLEKRTILSALALIKDLKKALIELDPACIISYMDQTNILALLALKKTKGTPIIVCERNNPARNLIISRKFPTWIQNLVRIFRNRIYRGATIICTQTEGAALYFKKKYPNKNVVTISNFIEAVEPKQSSLRENLIVSVARLVPEKGLAELIKVFAQLKKLQPEWKLEIYGEGPQRDSLKLLIKEFALEDSVKVLNKTSDIFNVYSRASIFALNSSFEGQPNALLEAMACGCAVIASDCDFGPGEFISDNINGLLFKVGENSELLEKLNILASSPELRANLGKNAIEVIKKYPRSAFTAHFEGLILELS